jgi:hypothetical protein
MNADCGVDSKEPEYVISERADCQRGRRFFCFYFSVRGALKIFFESVFVYPVKGFGPIGLQINVDSLRPTARLIGFRQSNTFPHKTRTAIKEFSSFGDGKKSFTVRHCVSGKKCNGCILALFAV